MLKTIRNLRLIISFIGYLVALYMWRIFGIMEEIDISTNNAVLVVVVGSILVFLISIILTYFEKNSNIIYYIFYSIMTIVVVYNSNIKSDLLFFFIVFLIIVIAIFCQYLYIVEQKVENVTYKDADSNELKKCYTKYISFLAAFFAIVFCLTVSGYKLIQVLAARVIMYLYESNTFFSLPAIGGFALIALICIFFLAMFFRTDKEDDI